MVTISQAQRLPLTITIVFVILVAPQMKQELPWLQAK
jgi:hypothetical protein